MSKGCSEVAGGTIADDDARKVPDSHASKVSVRVTGHVLGPSTTSDDSIGRLGAGLAS